MYLRRTSRRNADGSEVAYLALAHNHRDEGTTRAQVLLNLGREDTLDRAGLARLVSSINRYLGVDDEGPGHGPRAGAGGASALRLLESRPMGAVWLLDELWSQLGVADALRTVLGPRKFTTNMERVLFALVANRAVDPFSKLAAAQWVTHDTAVPGLASMSEDQAYRAMDLLGEADSEAKIQEAVFFAVANLLVLEVDVLFFDSTSTYFERDTEDPPTPGSDDPGDGGDPGRPGTGGFRRYGHSKDHRSDLPQIVIGLAVTKEGIPVRCWCWPGNTNDQSVITEVKDDLCGWRLGRVITVVDRGFSSKDNLAYLRRAGGHYIAGERMRDGNPTAQAALSRAGRYQQVRDNLRVKEVALPEDTPGFIPDVRWVVCHNPDEALRDAARREEHLARVNAELERITAARERTKTALAAAKTAAKTAGTAEAKSKTPSPAQLAKLSAKAAAEEAGHARAECALRDHRALGRWVKQTTNGRLVVDRAAVAADERLDGKYLLSTSDPHLPAEDIALGYKNLLEAERGFRDLKSTLDLRPVFHRIEPRIRSHVLLCWLALLLIRVAERRTGLTWRTIEREMSRLHAVTLVGPAGTVVQTTEPTDAQLGIVRTCEITLPPRVTAIVPA
jgi:hypothetical protein